jgi:hypothetical protein
MIIELDRSGNYDCPSCARVNCEVGIYVYYEGSRFPARYCSSCAFLLMMDEDAYVAYRKELEKETDEA